MGKNQSIETKMGPVIILWGHRFRSAPIASPKTIDNNITLAIILRYLIIAISTIRVVKADKLISRHLIRAKVYN